MLSIDKKAGGKNLIMALEGRLDTTTAPVLEKEVKESLEGVENLSFDLKSLEESGVMQMSQIADKVYRNAKVYSVALDGTETHAQALAIVDGRFAYVGDEAGVDR